MGFEWIHWLSLVNWAIGWIRWNIRKLVAFSSGNGSKKFCNTLFERLLEVNTSPIYVFHKLLSPMHSLQIWTIACSLMQSNIRSSSLSVGQITFDMFLVISSRSYFHASNTTGYRNDLK